MENVQDAVPLRASRGSLDKLKSVGGDMTGGAMGALVTIPIILSCGVVSYQSIGPSFVAAGIAAAFVSAIVAALVAGALGGPPLHINTPKTSHAAILSSLIAVVATHHSFSDHFSGDAAAQALIVTCLITLFISGLFQAALGVLRLGALVKFVPYPVLAGIINGFALQIIIGQIPNALGIDRLSQLAAWFSGSVPISWWPFAFTFLAGAFVTLGGRISKTIPPALTGLVVGALAYAAASHYVDPRSLGPVIGPLPAGIAVDLRMGDMLDFMSSLAFARHLFPIVATGATLALISSIQSLLSVSASDELFETRHDSNKELMVQGGANMMAALLGGAPTGGSPNATRTVHANGGRQRFANIALALALAATSFGLGDLIAHIPLSVMAGVVIASTAGTMDRWTQQLLLKVGTSSAASRRHDALLNLAVVLLVTELVILYGALAALGVGMTVVLFIFLYRSNSTVVSRVLHADQITSCTERPLGEVRAIAERSDQIAVLELAGPLFFGTTETVFQRVEREAAGARWIILSFKRCPVIDTSGAILLKQLAVLMRKTGKQLLLSDLPRGGQRREYLQSVGADQFERDGAVFDDLDSALSFAENELLGQAGLKAISDSEKSLTQFEILASLSKQEISTLDSMLERLQFSAGDCILREGDSDHGLYFLSSGKVSLYTGASGQPVRLVSYSAGVDALFGEMSIPAQEMRSAEVRADTDVKVLRLTADGFQALCRSHPAMAIRLMQGMSSELSSRLIRMMHLMREQGA